jgi:NACalpha-BTF3-like transcription factor
LRENGQVEDVIGFGNQEKLIYDLQAVDNASEVSAAYADNRICVTVPKVVAEQFANTEQVSLRGEQRTDLESALEILIEKDFKCIHKAEADNADAFPNPLAEAAHEQR